MVDSYLSHLTYPWQRMCLWGRCDLHLDTPQLLLFSDALNIFSSSTKRFVPSRLYVFSDALDIFFYQAIRRLRKHPNVIQLAEIIYDKGSRTLYLVCELMDMNIYELIKDRTHYLNDHKVKHYMYQLLQVGEVNWFIVWMIVWLIDWLIDLLVDRSIGW